MLAVRPQIPCLVGQFSVETTRRSWLEPLPIPQGYGDAVAEGVKEVVLTFAVLGADTKALDLVEQMVTRMTFVGGGFVKRRRRIFDAAPVHVAGHRHRPLVLTDGSELGVDRLRRHSPPQGLL